MKNNHLLNLSVILFTDIRLLALFLLMLVIAVPGKTQSAGASSLQDKLLIKASEIEQLFRLDELEKSTVNIYNSELKGSAFQAEIKSHLNKGDESGVLSISLLDHSSNYKLLLTRKVLYGKLKYKVKLLNTNTSVWYYADEIKDGYFQLIRTETNLIVTP